MKLVSAIVVTFRSWPEVVRAIGSVGRSAQVERIVVDNASGDGTLDRVGEVAPDTLRIAMETNGGFAAGANAGAARAGGEYLLFLNPDAALEPDDLERLVDYLERHPRAAAVGPRLVDDEGAEQPAARAFPTPSSEFARLWQPLAKRFGCVYAEPIVDAAGGSVDWISGACFLVRRSAWEAVGPMNERFFLYFEETDWCLRASRAGWEIHHLPAAVATHEGGTSTRRQGQLESGCLVEHHRRSRRRYFRAHHGATGSLVVETLHVLRRVYDAITKRSLS